MEQQDLPEGNIRNSHRETNPAKRKIAPKALQDKARNLVNQLGGEQGLVIRQRLDVERMKQPLQKGVFYVIENDGNADPGFLVFLPGSAPVFLQMRPKAPPPCTLRMRVSPTLAEGGGSVFIATLDAVHHMLRLEDVWMWKGAPIFQSQPYSERRKHLATFVEQLWIPDKRLLGGITTTVLNPTSVEEAFKTPFHGVYSIELLPEMAGRRRMWMEVEGRKQATEVAAALDAAQRKPKFEVKESPRTSAPAAKPPLTAEQKNTILPPIMPEPKEEIVRIARAVPVDKMPDIYDLYDETGLPISRASVQAFSLSQKIQEAAKKSTKGTWVSIRWRKEFGGWEIIGQQPAP